MEVEVRTYGQVNHMTYDEIIIRDHESEIGFSDLGARLTRWRTLDQKDIILALPDAQAAFAHRGYYYGTTVGRVAGRIAKGQFRIDNQTYQLDCNEGPNHLHGGDKGLDIRKWTYEIITQADGVKVVFSLVDKGDLGYYPGDMQIKVTHTYTNDHTWRVDYEANTQMATLFNPTNHVYFNLNGNLARDIKNHRVRANVSAYTPVHSDGLPTGQLLEVAGTPFDLRQGQVIGDILQSEDPQIQLKAGYDHAFKFEEGKLATLCVSNDTHQVHIQTNAPAVVIYTHAFAEAEVLVHGQPLYPYAGVAIETQALPDAINQEGFGNILLQPNQVFHSWTTYQLK